MNATTFTQARMAANKAIFITMSAFAVCVSDFIVPMFKVCVFIFVCLMTQRCNCSQGLRNLKAGLTRALKLVNQPLSNHFLYKT